MPLYSNNCNPAVAMATASLQIGSGAFLVSWLNVRFSADDFLKLPVSVMMPGNWYVMIRPRQRNKTEG